MTHNITAIAARLLLMLLAASAFANAAAYPRRIISTAPSITETLFALGLGDRVVGVTQYCRYPKEVSRIPKIGSWTTLNMEVILSARPDLIIVQKTAVHNAAKFKDAGLRTLEVRIDSLQDVLDALTAIGEVGGVPEKAREVRVSLEQELNAVRQRAASRPPTKVLFVVGRNPGTLEGIIAVSGKSYLSEILTLAGGQNIFGDSRLSFARIVQEEILARNPDVIIDMGEHADAAGLTPAQRASEQALWGRYSSVNAVRNKRVHIVASELFVVPGPRVGQLARELARLLHPESFR